MAVASPCCVVYALTAQAIPLTTGNMRSSFSCRVTRDSFPGHTPACFRGTFSLYERSRHLAGSILRANAVGCRPVHHLRRRQHRCDDAAGGRRAGCRLQPRGGAADHRGRRDGGIAARGGAGRAGAQAGRAVGRRRAGGARCARRRPGGGASLRDQLRLDRREQRDCGVGGRAPVRRRRGHAVVGGRPRPGVDECRRPRPACRRAGRPRGCAAAAGRGRRHHVGRRPGASEPAGAVVAGRTVESVVSRVRHRGRLPGVVDPDVRRLLPLHQVGEDRGHGRVPRAAADQPVDDAPGARGGARGGPARIRAR